MLRQHQVHFIPSDAGQMNTSYWNACGHYFYGSTVKKGGIVWSVNTQHNGEAAV